MPLFQILSKTAKSGRPIMGFMDVHGNVVIEPQFLQTFGDFSEAGYAVVQRPGEKQHIIINTLGETVFVIPKDHKSVSFTPPDKHGVFGVMHQVDADNKDLWHLDGRDWAFQGETHYYAMRLDGSIAFEAYLSGAIAGYYVFSNSGKINDKRGLMNHEGQVVLPPIYDQIRPSTTDPYVTVMKDGAANVFTFDGTAVFRQWFEIGRSTDLRPVTDGFWVAPTPAKGHADVFDVTSTEVIGTLPTTYWSPMIPRACPTLSGGIACIKHPEKGSAYFFPDGRAAMPGILGRPRWFKPEMRTGYFYEGRASFKLGEVWGYLDLSGRHAITPQFYSNLPFRDELARVRYPADGNSWDRYSYVDREGSVVWHQED
ncbi:WG repeat-containing protein [Pseudaestuariivita rosea]|uniref:WG repeat-containing protein n=1 Tax=Pseudaestuariivita rosea TaxID=2763263 RepID=UPI001ABA4451|nr:WG repeat-containing protein [Pseudaestuariivita rosea]